MAGKFPAAIVLGVIAIIFMTSSFVSQAQVLEVTCSKFDGFGACYHNDWEKRDKLAAACSESHERWSYSYMWGGRCYCYRCIKK
jgi:hypothetical protein